MSMTFVPTFRNRTTTRDEVVVSAAKVAQLMPVICERIVEEIQSVENREVAEETARRDVFNTSWLVRLLPFLRRATDRVSVEKVCPSMCEGSSPRRLAHLYRIGTLRVAIKLSATAQSRAVEKLFVSRKTWESLIRYAP